MKVTRIWVHTRDLNTTLCGGILWYLRQFAGSHTPPGYNVHLTSNQHFPFGKDINAFYERIVMCRYQNQFVRVILYQSSHSDCRKHRIKILKGRALHKCKMEKIPVMLLRRNPRCQMWRRRQANCECWHCWLYSTTTYFQSLPVHLSLIKLPSTPYSPNYRHR